MTVEKCCWPTTHYRVQLKSAPLPTRRNKKKKRKCYVNLLTDFFHKVFNEIN